MECSVYLTEPRSDTNAAGVYHSTCCLLIDLKWQWAVRHPYMAGNVFSHQES